MKKRKVMTCLVAGVLVLAVSATAAFGSVNGYSRYKEAVKALALENDNFSAVGTMEMTMDGETVWTMGAEIALDQAESSTILTMQQGDYEELEVSANVDGQHIWYTDDDGNTYHSMPSDRDEGPYNLLGFEADDEYENRLITFFEVACDTVVGELKNNFVQVGTQDGVDLYQVDIAQAQVPSLVNAGLSLFAYAMTEENSNAWQTAYEDFDATRFHYYETQTGKTLPQEFKDAYTGGWSDEWYQANQALVDEFDAVCYGDGTYWCEAYDRVLEDNNGGVVYVYADGSYDYYPDQWSFIEAHPEESANNMEAYIGEDLALENIHCTFGVDNDGNLTQNYIAVTFVTTGRDGNLHEVVIAGEVELFDFGTTTVTLPDLGDRTELAMGKPTAESVEVEEW
ncbi:MAG: hypothetical protein IKB65_05040 [Ruminiclostridium sp.]|nr:hypothetical protein [Ruminiclostridium sp.]